MKKLLPTLALIFSLTTLAQSNTPINEFPYTESFENDFGDWKQATNDFFDWALNSGSTPSFATGPSAASDGNQYIYVESSAPNYSRKKAILKGPTFDLTNHLNPVLQFDYHMYGASFMGKMMLQVKPEGGSWTRVWKEKGNKGDQWNTATIDLSAYEGQVIKLRLRGITGFTWRGDMAIDNMVLTADPIVVDMDLNLSLTFDNFPEETSWELTDDAGTIVYFGDNYGNQADQSTMNIPLTLPDGCYTFTIKDIFGDGFCCTYGNGAYALTNLADATIYASGSTYGLSQSTDFCIGNATPTTAKSQLAQVRDVYPTIPVGIKIFPVPTRDVLNVQFPKDQVSVAYRIINTLGQEVATGILEEKSIDVSDLREGIYMIEFLNGGNNTIKRFVKQ